MAADLYDTLGVEPDASEADIRSAYRLRVQLLHPDRHDQTDEALIQEASRATARLNEAWEVLSDPVRRARYDAERRFRAGSQPVDRTPRLRSPGPGECDACGCAPAAQIELWQIAGLVVFATRSTLILEVCRNCGLNAFRTAMDRTLLLGWWSPIGLIWNLLAIYTNVKAWLALRKLHGARRSRDIESLLDRPVDPGPAVHKRVGFWVTVIGWTVLLGATLGSSSGSPQTSSTYSGSSYSSFRSTPPQVQATVTTQESSWAIGACVSESGDMETVVPCTEAHTGRVVASAGYLQYCPSSVSTYVTVGLRRYCISDTTS